MKTFPLRNVALLCLLLLLAATPAVVAEQKATSPLAEAMGRLEAAYQRLELSIADDSRREENLSTVEELISAAEQALTMEPSSASRLEGEQRDRMVAHYRKALKAMIEDARELQAMVDRQAPAAERKAQLEKVYSHQAGGHERYQESDQSKE